MSMTALTPWRAKSASRTSGTMRKHEVIFHILQKNAEGRGRDVLRGRPGSAGRGFWLLALPKFQLPAVPGGYLRSPSQIRRFDLQTGNLVGRPDPAAEGEGEILRVAQGRSRGREDPDKAKEKTHFDNLTPLFPNKRFILETIPEK